MVNVVIGCSGFGFDFDYLLNVIKIPVTHYSNQCYGTTEMIGDNSFPGLQASQFREDGRGADIFDK